MQAVLCRKLTALPTTLAPFSRRQMSASVAYNLEGKRVWVAGHRGMAGSAVVRRLGEEHCNILTVTRAEVDLRRQAEVEAWMERAQPQAVFVAAATVGGILANATRPAEFLYDNLAIETNIIHAARKTGVEKLLLLGILVHLSAAGAAADDRGAAAHRPAGVDQ